MKHSSRIQAAEMRYLKGAYGVIKWDGVSNGEVYRCGMSKRGKDMGCGVIVWLK